MLIHSGVVKSNTEESNLFNFQSAFSAPSIVPDINDMQEAPPNSLRCMTITLSEVYRALVSLDPNKAFGSDNISPKVLRPDLCFCSV